MNERESREGSMEPRNRVGEPPTTQPEETAERLREKASWQQGEANRDLTEEQIAEVDSEQMRSGER
jgi:hypothetical protein